MRRFTEVTVRPGGRTPRAMQLREAANGGDDPRRRAPSYVPGLTSLVFPVYNPGPMLDATLAALVDFLADVRRPWEIVFVCDGVTDGAECRLAEWVANRPGDARVLAYRHNRGKGHAVRVGMLHARGEWRIFTDIDLAYRFDDVEALARLLRGGAPVAIASRVHPETRIFAPPHLLGYLHRRSLQSRAFSRLVRWLLPIRQHDTQAGLKGMSAQAAAALLPRLHADRFEFDCELLTGAACLGLDVAESPVTVFYDTSSSTVTGWSALQMLAGIRRIARRWRQGPPAPESQPVPMEPAIDLVSARKAPVEMAA